MNGKYVSVIILLFCFESMFGISDTLVFKGGNVIVGEIKKMEKGILEIDASFGDENFKIKWLSVSEIYTESKFLINVRDKIYEGRIASVSEQKVKVFDQDSIYTICALDEIVYLTQVKNGFSNRFSAAAELGFNLSKAQNLRQFSIRSSAAYKGNKWTLEASYNIIRSSQDDAEPIKRTDGLLNYRHLLFRKWYGIATMSTLSNTEQLLDLRANSQLGLGNFLYSSNKAYWGVKTGLNNNLEKFSNETDNRNSWEGYLGTELNLYNVGDVDLLFVFMGYSGLTDTRRYRTDMNLDLKYDLPLDLFIRLGISFNYDNRPAQNASDTDYIIRTGIGWEW